MNPELPSTTTFSRPGEPTNAAPGSERKIHILTERAARREPLFHPQDYQLKQEPDVLPLPAGPEIQRMESA